MNQNVRNLFAWGTTALETMLTIALAIWSIKMYVELIQVIRGRRTLAGEVISLPSRPITPTGA